MPRRNTFPRLRSYRSAALRRTAAFAFSGLLLTALSANASNKPLDKAIIETELMHQQGATSQSVILKSQETTRQLLTEFQALNKALDQLKINHAHSLETQAQQLHTINSLNHQLNEIEVTETNIVPQLLSMVDWLDDFIDSDIPFHAKERQQRIEYLKTSMIDPDISLPERYRRVLEAYQIESEYGYTIESYTATISVADEHLQVSILKIGRIGLYYQSEDGQYSGYWNTLNRQWQEGPESLAEEVKKGLLMAQKQRPHALLSLPVLKSK